MDVTSVRQACADDYPAFLRLFPELAVDDPVPTADRWVAEMAPATLVAQRADGILGYIYYQTLSGAGYIRHLVVAPLARGAGLGRRLMDAVAERLRAQGAREWHLNVKPGNLPAIRLYERAGMRLAYESVALRIPWSQVDRLGEPLTSVSAGVIPPEEDHAFEQAFVLPAGQLGDARKHSGRVVLGLRDADGVPAGVAAFDPHYPGAFPFRAARPALARSLLEAMRPHALPELPHVGMVVEDDDALAAALLAAGAEERLKIAHYQGGLF